MTPPDQRRKRILVSAVSFADADSALRLASLLEFEGGLDLGGLLVTEDTLALRAAMPGQRLVTPGGAMVSAPTEQQLRSMIRSEARAFRERLLSVAEALSAVGKFESRRGDLTRIVLEVAEGWDVLLLGYSARHRCRGNVILIVPPSGLSKQSEALAAALARSLGTGLATVALAGGPAAKMPGDCQVFASRDALLAHIARQNAAAVLSELSTGLSESFRQLQDLLEHARCPVILTNPTGREALE